MPEYGIYRRGKDMTYHALTVTVQARDLDDVIRKLNDGIAGHFDVHDGDTVLVRRRVGDNEYDSINTLRVNVPVPRFERACPRCGSTGYVVADVLRCGNAGCANTHEYD